MSVRVEGGAREVLLRATDVVKHFPVSRGLVGERKVVHAVDGVSLEVAAGETLGVVGESGCGKSTLGHAVLQLIPPTSGQVVWVGCNIAGLDHRAMRQLRCEMQNIFQ